MAPRGAGLEAEFTELSWFRTAAGPTPDLVGIGDESTS
jgi:hypothetical protein